jgi:plastocyanin
MRFRIQAAMVAVTALVATACADQATGPASSTPGNLTSGALLARGQHNSHVIMQDACDPTTFNAIFGAGTCLRNGGVTFERFIEQIENSQKAPGWFFAPSNINTIAGSTITAYNRGGEVHTFTEVAAFGGGFITELNGISGNPVPAPECLNFGTMVFVPAGGSDEVTVGAAGEHHFQCCIHPWMRATAQVR